MYQEEEPQLEEVETFISVNAVNCTRIVAVYGTGRPKPKWLGTVHQQQVRYIQNNDMDTNPLHMFETDFHVALRAWRAQRDQVLVSVNANEYVLTRKFINNLYADNELNWLEVRHN